MQILNLKVTKAIIAILMLSLGVICAAEKTNGSGDIDIGSILKRLRTDTITQNEIAADIANGTNTVSENVEETKEIIEKVKDTLEEEKHTSSKNPPAVTWC